jgi:uncharacterized protein
LRRFFLYLISPDYPVTLLRQLILVLGMLHGLSSVAQPSDVSVPGYVVDIELQTEQQFSELLTRAEQLFLEGGLSQDGGTGVTLVLHGPVLRSLLRGSYRDSKAMVDQAASLSALGVVKIQACRSWLGYNGLSESELQPFVGVVSFGPAEVVRLVEEEGYIEF